MFDIGWTEITIIVIVAIIVIGPKDLPRVLRTVGQWVGKAKAMTREFRGHIDDMIQETDLADIKKQIDSVGTMDVEKMVENTIDPNSEIKEAFDFSGDEFSNPLEFKDEEKKSASEYNPDDFEEELDEDLDFEDSDEEEKEVVETEEAVTADPHDAEQKKGEEA